ncbi:DNA methyltransferase [Methylobacterium sp. WL120]|uniref:DNA methyltransferase n=1 Tax=Methylobacterium sp. WL120 TaxID=2603887 RepID=UPI0011C990DB|nr:DNA methyltransferase [Methylobacterium sp. WL120]TXM67683.1 site-specific DNA-methyltransferase [Methylobacterium sp. WL120]
MTDLTTPSSYAGLYNFHKYWGKKPVEPLRALISVLSDKGDVVSDPFLGSGGIAKEAVILGRRFLGSEINPIAIRLTEFNINPCTKDSYRQAIKRLADIVKDPIQESYTVAGLGVTSHLLWENGSIDAVWQRPSTGIRRRVERDATAADYELSASYEDYKPSLLRNLTVFKNSRINATVDLDWKKLFSGRALRNIELLLGEIRNFPTEVRLALELTLTASIGQMSRMVFAITSRGKTTGSSKGKTEVGSWVIGFWRPKQHFEINAWNCFEARANKLLKALPDSFTAIPLGSSASNVLTNKTAVYVNSRGAADFLDEIPDNTLQLVITDPPHGDRIPYLELSEIWNAILGESPNLRDEVVVSNAVGRCMKIDEYNLRLTSILQYTAAKLKIGGFIVLLFNSRHQREWQALKALSTAADMNLIGSMPLNYSARSVVQDNREGAMKTDFIVVYGKGVSRPDRLRELGSVPGWINALPTEVF